MSEHPPVDDAGTFERLAQEGRRPIYLLRLYVAGTTPNSARALRTVKRLCEQYLAGRYTLEVIDIYQERKLAEDDQILAVPTLLRRKPEPLRRVIGDLSNEERLLAGLELPRKSS